MDSEDMLRATDHLYHACRINCAPNLFTVLLNSDRDLDRRDRRPKSSTRPLNMADPGTTQASILQLFCSCLSRNPFSDKNNDKKKRRNHKKATKKNKIIIVISCNSCPPRCLGGRGCAREILSLLFSIPFPLPIPRGQCSRHVPTHWGPQSRTIRRHGTPLCMPVPVTMSVAVSVSEDDRLGTAASVPASPFHHQDPTIGPGAIPSAAQASRMMPPRVLLVRQLQPRVDCGPSLVVRIADAPPSHSLKVAVHAHAGVEAYAAFIGDGGHGAGKGRG